MYRNLNFLHMTDFFLHGHRPCVRDKYQVWVYVLQGEMEELRSERTANSFLPFHSAHLRAAWLCIKIIMVPFSARLSSSFLQQLLSGFQTLSSPFARPTACIKIIMVLIPRRLFLNFLNTGYISFQANTPTSGWNPEHKFDIFKKKSTRHLNSRAIQCRAAIHIGRSMHWKQPLFVSGWVGEWWKSRWFHRRLMRRAGQAAWPVANQRFHHFHFRILAPRVKKRPDGHPSWRLEDGAHV